MATTETPVTPATETPAAVAAAPAAPEATTPAATPTPAASAPKAVKAAKVPPKPAVYMEINVKDILMKAGENPRTGELPEIEALAKTIDEEGMLQPIVVTPATDVPGKYRMVAGWRRLTAVRTLGHTTISARIVDADAAKRLKLALVENIQKEDMSPLDKANGIANLIKSTGLEQGEVASALGVAPGFISQYLSILALPPSAIEALKDGSISFTHARELVRLVPNVKAIDDLVFEAADLTVAQLSAKVTHLVALAKEAASEAEAEAEEEEGEKPKKKKAAKPAPSEKEVMYYIDAEFKPLKKEDIRSLMIDYKRKEVSAESDAKRAEFRLILKGITLAADLRLK